MISMQSILVPCLILVKNLCQHNTSSPRPGACCKIICGTCVLLPLPVSPSKQTTLAVPQITGITSKHRGHVDILGKYQSPSLKMIGSQIPFESHWPRLSFPGWEGAAAGWIPSCRLFCSSPKVRSVIGFWKSLAANMPVKRANVFRCSCQEWSLSWYASVYAPGNWKSKKWLKTRWSTGLTPRIANCNGFKRFTQIDLDLQWIAFLLPEDPVSILDYADLHTSCNAPYWLSPPPYTKVIHFLKHLENTSI